MICYSARRRICYLLQSKNIKEPQVEGEELKGNSEIELLLSEEEEEASA